MVFGIVFGIISFVIVVVVIGVVLRIAYGIDFGAMPTDGRVWDIILLFVALWVIGWVFKSILVVGQAARVVTRGAHDEDPQEKICKGRNFKR